MALTVKDLFEMDVFKNFKVLAGEGGLDRKVEGTDMLDHEFVRGARMKRETVMIKNHLVLSTLMYTGGDPKLMTEAVRLLYEQNVAGLAYKNGLGYDIPKEALKFADEHDFPILEFGEDEFYEDVILAIHEICGRDNEIIENEMKVEAILRGEMGAQDETRFGKLMLEDPRKYIMAVYVRCGELDRDRLSRAIGSLGKYNKSGSKAYAFKFRNGYFVFLSQDTDNLKMYDAQFVDVNALLDFGTENTNAGFSLVYRSENGFAKALKEAYWASSVAFLEGEPRKDIEDIGIYRMLIAEINSPEMTGYMQEYLAPILIGSGAGNNPGGASGIVFGGGSGIVPGGGISGGVAGRGSKGAELLDTAETYVLCNGDLDETAKKLFCHKNTIRYRLSRLHEMLSPGATEKEFYVSLSVAIRLYILQRLL